MVQILGIEVLYMIDVKTVGTNVRTHLERTEDDEAKMTASSTRDTYDRKYQIISLCRHIPGCAFREWNQETSIQQDLATILVCDLRNAF